MKPFVGVKQISSQDELKKLLEKLSEPSYYFLRWVDKVSGILPELKEFSPEGQMFNSKMELRWRQGDLGYEVLLLSQDEPDVQLGFKPIGSSWQIVERQAHFYRETETRFPKGFSHQDIKIGQRYFMDKDTATVRFVALTVSQ
ncbi:hypothetical protein F7734_40485 [Scytonema sp. UIC 10036]|uniref:hypothetical protein n=1 Tax=Scytonema sp. UIC 10036 TaxID=2304196 RepID=UPI0012DACFCF|nr:hypothetical protein [Scytonema sp. UIC 10036]MUG98254.1 hypothetical protein [Scytonema sp. UIC 10036]